MLPSLIAPLPSFSFLPFLSETKRLNNSPRSPVTRQEYEGLNDNIQVTALHLSVLPSPNCRQQMVT